MVRTNVVFPMFLNSKATLLNIMCIKISGRLPWMKNYQRLRNRKTITTNMRWKFQKRTKWLDMFPVIFTSARLRGGTIKCEITGKRQNKRGNGLEVPCKYIVKRPFHMVLNIEKIIKDYLSRTAKWKQWYIPFHIFEICLTFSTV